MTAPYADASGASNAAAPVSQSEFLAQTYVDGRYEFSGDRNIDAALIGTRWTPSTLTYSFPTTAAAYAGSGYAAGQEPDHFAAFNGLQQDSARAAFRLVASYTNLHFVEVSDADGSRPTFRLGQTGLPTTADGDPYTAMAEFPTEFSKAGDVWFSNTSGQAYYPDPQRGNWGAATMMHEIGHALGLKHGQDDYTSQDLNGDLGRAGAPDPRYGSVALPADRNGQDFSLMSYNRSPAFPWIKHGNEPEPNEAGTVDYNRQNPQTYMQIDIAALQYLYGANFGTNAGDTTYSWNATDGTMAIDGVGQGIPVDGRILMTVWDGGGTDTYDLSNYATNLDVDLAPGAFSTLDVAQRVTYLSHDRQQTAPSLGNVANALLYQGDIRSLIENATGGTGNDAIGGNDAGNTLLGGDGADTLGGVAGDDLLKGQDGTDSVLGGIGNDFGSGGWGNDTVLGEAGNDLLFGDDDDDWVDGNEGDDLVYGGTGTDTVFGSAGGDTVYGEQGNDFIGTGSGDDLGVGGDGNDEVHGEEGRDVLSGGEGNDGVYGEDGDDVVSGDGGNDYLTGDAGADSLIGGGGGDQMFGGTGGDTLSGGEDSDSLSGGADGDTLDGGAGADLLFGNSGDDALTGGAGADVFAFGRGDGLDRILDFVLGGPEADVIAFNNGAFADFAGVQAASRQDGADVLIAYGSGDVLALQNVQLSSLSAQSFTFA
ncbi:M10 family metallopeptidase [Methylobacterium oryzihabitans]|nr:M10 family metallopeptidase C-terminal domain-containing protein [Methylobacterium oryzihabitans]